MSEDTKLGCEEASEQSVDQNRGQGNKQAGLTPEDIYAAIVGEEAIALAT